MSWFIALLIALVVGAAEILPLSGDAQFHIFAKLLGVTMNPADAQLFRGFLHLGTAFALLAFYRMELFSMVRELLVLLGIRRPTIRRRGTPIERRQLLLYLIAALPMVAALLLRKLRSAIEGSSGALVFIAVLVALTGGYLYLAGRGASQHREDRDMTLRDALSLGACQALSVLPGVSRAGITMGTALLRGFSFPSAVQISGIMGLPVFLCSGFLEVFTAHRQGTVGLSAAMCILGFALAAILGIVTLHILSRSADRRRPTAYAYWCWGSGLIAFALFLISS